MLYIVYCTVDRLKSVSPSTVCHSSALKNQSTIVRLSIESIIKLCIQIQHAHHCILLTWTTHVSRVRKSDVIVSTYFRRCEKSIRRASASWWTCLKMCILMCTNNQIVKCYLISKIGTRIVYYIFYTNSKCSNMNQKKNVLFGLYINSVYASASINHVQFCIVWLARIV